MSAPVFPAGRYGRRRAPRRAGRWIVPVLVAVVVLGTVGIAARLYGQYGDTAPEPRVLRWSVVSDQAIRIEFELPGGRTEPARCTLRSRGRDGGEVGRTVVTVPAGDKVLVRKVVLPTRARAVTGELVGCQT